MTHRSEAVKARALLASGDEFLRAYLERVLAHAPLEAFSVVADGASALERLQEDAFDVALIDVNLDGIGGLGLLAALRAEPRTAKIPVVITTAVGDPDAVRTAIELGVSDYLLKPFVEDVVRKRIERVVRRPPRPEPRQTAPARVLIADGDPATLEALGAALRPDFSVATVRSLREWMLKAPRFRPEVVVADPATFGPRLSACLDALARSRPETPFLLVAAGADQLQGRAELAATLPKPLEPAELRVCLERILGGPADARGLLAALAEELPEIVGRALGMLTGSEVQASGPAAEIPEPVAASLRLLPKSNEEGLRLTLAADLDLARAWAADISGVDADGLPPNLARDVLEELVNLIGGGLKRLAADRGAVLRVGLPALVEPPAATPEAPAAWFVWGGRGPFAVTLEGQL